jgi:hypothetical protein
MTRTGSSGKSMAQDSAEVARVVEVIVDWRGGGGNGTVS